MPGNEAFPASRAVTVAAESGCRCEPGRRCSTLRPCRSRFTIAHLSDIHCGDAHFVPDLMERAIADINAMCPDIVICSGDLTTFGFKEEYAQAKRYLDRLDVRVVRRHPGEPRLAQRRLRPLREPLRQPQLGAAQGRDHASSRSTRPSPTSTTARSAAAATRWIEEQFAAPADMRIFVLHHHLLPVPGTGRERNIVYDAGDVIECLQRAGVNLVLSGHKHVPYAWRLENLFVVSTGTVSCLRLRGATRPCYNVIEVDGHARRDLAPLPVPRPGADHPVRPRDARVREVHRPDRARGDPAAVRAVALIDGEHYPDVVREALRGAAVRVGGRDPRRRDREAARRRRLRRAAARRLRRRRGRRRPLGRAGARARRTASAGPRRRSRPGCRTSAPTSASTRPSYADVRAAVDRRDRRRQARREDRARRRTSRRCSRATATWSWSRWAAAGPAEPEVIERRPTVDRPRRALARRPARGLRLPRDRGDLRRADDRLPPRRRRARRAGLRLERRSRARGSPPSASRTSSSSTASGASIPPIAVDRRVLARRRTATTSTRTSTPTAGSSPTSSSRSTASSTGAVTATLRLRPLEPLEGRVAVFTAGRRRRRRTSTPTSSTSRRASPTATRCAASSRALEADTYLVEVKAAAIDVVAEDALARGRQRRARRERRRRRRARRGAARAAAARRCAHERSGATASRCRSASRAGCRTRRG